ncbi:MAG: hypothetical protein ABW033_02195 [Acidimicrobiia bacterium]
MKQRLNGPAGRFSIACAGGGFVALIVLGWFATRHGIFNEVRVGNFYEVQARSWLHGRWDAAPDAYAFERFAVHGRYFTYFGPWPALLRLPFVAFTHGLDGRLTAIAVLLACTILLVGVAGLSWEARRVWRDDAMPTRRELLAAAGLMVLVALGTTVVFLSGWTAVYQEAILWGVAWSLVSFWCLVRYLRAERISDLAFAAAAAAFAVLSRGSVGIGPIVALGLVAAAKAVVAVRARRGYGLVVGVALAAVVPFALYAWVNITKFGAPLGIPPIELQDRLVDWPPRQAAMAANDGSLFGIRFAPTILLHYLRPDGIRFDRLFPWVTFPPTARVIGGAVFESLNPSASMTSASPVSVLLSVGGVVAVTRGVIQRTAARRFTAPLLGAAAGAVGAVSLAFLDQRYEGDFVPILVVAGVVGAWWLARWLSERGPWLRSGIVALVTIGSLWGVWANSGLTYLYTHAYQPDAGAGRLADMVATQLRVHDLLGDGPPSRVIQVDALPMTTSAPAGTLAVVGDCDGLLWSDGRLWHAVEQTAATGLYPLRVRLDRAQRGNREPVASIANGDVTTVLWALPDEEGARLELTWFDGAGVEHVVTTDSGRRRSSVVVPDGETVDVMVRLDPGVAFVPVASVEVDGEVVLDGVGPTADGKTAGEPIALGTQPFPEAGATTLSGTVTEGARPGTPSCDRIRNTER